MCVVLKMEAKMESSLKSSEVWTGIRDTVFTTHQQDGWEDKVN